MNQFINNIVCYIDILNSYYPLFIYYNELEKSVRKKY